MIVIWDRFLGLFFCKLYLDYHPLINAWVTVAPLKPVSDQYVEDNVLFLARKVFNSDKSYIVFLIYF